MSGFSCPSHADAACAVHDVGKRSTDSRAIQISVIELDNQRGAMEDSW